MPWIKLLATTKRDSPGMRSREDYVDLWRCLRETFPKVFAACLMPDHVHLVLSAPSEAIALTAFVQCLRTYAQSRGVSLWSKVGQPESISNQKHLSRMIRYIHLNPCRDHLVRDPLSWEWSTHRDAMGATTDPWIDLMELQRLVGVAPARTRETFHKYVSGDPDVEVGGTPIPRKLPHLVAALPTVQFALLSAMRAKRVDRRLMIHLARRVGDPSRTSLSQILGVTPKTISVLGNQGLNTSEERTVQAALLILSDPRMLPPWVRPT